MIIKHSKRTVRRGCELCGDNDLYWGHDESDKSAEYCSDCNSVGVMVLINKDGDPHDWTCPGTRSNPWVEPETTAPVVPSPFVVEAPATPAPTAPAPDAFAAFQALMSSLAPKVDRAEVESMIRAQLDSVVFPEKLIVERATGERREITGAHAMLGEVVTDLLAGMHVMMVGPAGTGKSTIAENAAEALGLPYYSISLSPMTPASQILGYMDANGNAIRTLYREAYQHGGLFHFDEFDNSHPSVIAVVNASLSNGHMAFADGMVKRHDDFRCVASANTYGRGADRQYVGRQQMDAATLDRFAVETIPVDEALETELCKATGLDGGRVNDVLTYTRKLRKSAEDQCMRVIVSPRASIGMCKLIREGKSWDAAAECVIFKGMSQQDRTKLGS